ncbi:hypothetical protein A3A93_06225 [Candidatus Roizmanbacteria bacterium RIFCSPLOWO2_01_FULL_38_12]|uniref:Glycosyltransferase RgtA/B/C/D-like domain-containing protein n=1 Tax=Candidatus Roizmanbacteria bacterium RIFCSPLOWO2_01_FULL_38_12 TaxID=1802061 RepID=A0A1F7IU03_9BACT|nr:MAG: hypothetical protein A2861_01995 [Candidatus Roizmanbacteria bacterium RIFCSPHIGHO2_01_FULL_38_15]OGK34841.1 MAG: hypothetical protein A3F59_00540 [Candidatus Roizmanbacteria bacterium RIFCSPHIGHO2_12_FULL_38_13]OGK46826.1 MAG: hypothetical protein A3A93_06225 [Candidatus Roizmanbacteria bacterium RIFCSPLOWO2_01_FULL_38_12]
MKFAKLPVLFFLLFAILVFTRFVGLDWGLPYPMHPDERNMVVAILDMNCANGFSLECLNPHFFAYGQLPLYLGLVTFKLIHFLFPDGMIHFQAALALRINSALFSVFTVIVLMKMIRLFDVNKKVALIFFYIMSVFTPAFIQFSHFGTTESHLMFFYTCLVYLSLKFIFQQSNLKNFAIMSGIVFGLALGTKISAIIFALIPFFAILFHIFTEKNNYLTKKLILFFVGLLLLISFTLLFFIISSPYNFASWNEFIGSMRYESEVGLGVYRAFYTKQFEYSLPILFQSVKIFPYALGMPIYLLFILGFIFLPWNKTYNFVRFQFLLYFIPTAFLYAKWTRFLVPVFPIMVFFAGMFFIHIFQKITLNKYLLHTIFTIIFILTIIPGIAYLAIYLNTDVRFTASSWIYRNLPNDVYVLAETANVIDIPVPAPNMNEAEYIGKHYKTVSFNFYDVDSDRLLSQLLSTHINQAGYFFVPSRRIFANHTCYQFQETLISATIQGYQNDRCYILNKKYSRLHDYYNQLFNNSSKYTLVKEFSSYPRIEVFGHKLIEFPDENAEETWTVFDHPVIRIYKKI